MPGEATVHDLTWIESADRWVAFADRWMITITRKRTSTGAWLGWSIAKPDEYSPDWASGWYAEIADADVARTKREAESSYRFYRGCFES